MKWFDIPTPFVRGKKSPNATTPDEPLRRRATRRQFFERGAGVVVGGAVGAHAAFRPSAATAQTTTFVDTTSNQTVGGIKTFTSPPVVPAGSLPESAVAGLVADLGAKAPATGPFAPAAPGASAQTRFVGGTASGAPTTATFETGDFVIDQTGKVWICTLGGNPGTWAQQGGVSLSGDQTISGVKTFTSAPVVPSDSFPLTAVGGLLPALAGKQPAITPGTYVEFADVRQFGAQADGSDDWGAIAAAVAAVSGSAERAVVYFPPGVYMVSQSVVIPSDLIVLGAGRRRSFIMAGSAFPLATSEGLFKLTDASRTTIRGIGFQANGRARRAVMMTRCSDCFVEDCWMANDGFFWSLYVGLSSRNCGIVNCLSDGTADADGGGSHNVEFNDSSFCLVQGCHLKLSAGANIELYLNTIGENIGHRIIGNLLEQSGSIALVLDGARDVTVMNNILRQSGSHAISIQNSELKGADAPARSNMIVGNSILSSGASGITITGASGANVISNNSIRKSAQKGIVCTSPDNTITANVCEQNQYDGISVQAAACSVLGNHCADNSLAGLNQGYGITLSSPASGCSVVGNRCTDTKAATAKLQNIGIRINPGVGLCYVAGNNGSGNRQAGLSNATSNATNTLLCNVDANGAPHVNKINSVLPRAGQLVDNSGGVSGGTTVGAVTTMASAANAIATLAARVNLLESKLSLAAGGLGVTA